MRHPWSYQDPPWWRPHILVTFPHPKKPSFRGFEGQRLTHVFSVTSFGASTISTIRAVKRYKYFRPLVKPLFQLFEPTTSQTTVRGDWRKFCKIEPAPWLKCHSRIRSVLEIPGFQWNGNEEICFKNDIVRWGKAQKNMKDETYTGTYYRWWKIDAVNVACCSFGLI